MQKKNRLDMEEIRELGFVKKKRGEFEMNTFLV